MAYKIYQQLESGMAGKGLITAVNIDDNALGKTQAELNALFNANLAKTIEFIPVDELPAASAETLQKIYLIPSPNAQVQNVKDEYVTIRKNVMVYEVGYIVFRPSGQPSVASEGLTGVLTDGNSVATLDIYQNGVLVNTFTPERGTVVCVPGDNVHYVVYDPSSGQSQTAKGWIQVDRAYETEYFWEQIGTTTVDLSGYPTTQQMNAALASYATLEDLQSSSSTAASRMSHIEEEIEPEPTVSATNLWNPVCEVYADQACTTRPTGSVSSVWVKLPKLPSDDFSFGQQNFEKLVYEEQSGDAEVTLWGQFVAGFSSAASEPIVVEAIADNATNITGYHTTFYPDGTSE